MEQISTVADVSSDTSDAMVIEVLLELVYTGKVTIDPGTVTERLRVRGVRVSEQQVEQVFKQFGIDWSKKSRPHHRHSCGTTRESALSWHSLQAANVEHSRCICPG